MWQIIIESINGAVKKFVPSISMNDKFISQHIKPPRLKKHVRSLLRRKKMAYTFYLKNRKDYSVYVKQRNKARRELCKALRNYEKGMA